MKKLITVLFAMIAPLALFAHPGHGEHEGNVLLHHLLTYWCFVPLIILAAGIFLTMKNRKSTSIQN